MTDSNLVYSSETGVGDDLFLSTQGEGAVMFCGQDGCTGTLFLDGPRAVFAYCNTCDASLQWHCCETCAYGPEDGAEESYEVDEAAVAAAWDDWEASFPRTEWDEEMDRIFGVSES